MAQKSDELVRRIAKLAYHNQELTNQLKLLTQQYEELVRINEQKDKLIASFTSKGETLKEIPEEKSMVEKFQMVTILFASIHGFSKISSTTNSDLMMDELDRVLLFFDKLVKKQSIEKIKTIGDSYMAAGGIPQKNITNPVQVVMAALEMKHYIEYLPKKNENKDKIWDIKIGIHTGPLTANISGKAKTNYDLKGDTVNIATRIESICEMNRLLISAMTYELVKEFFQCEYYGKIPVKYKDDLELFQVNGIRPEFSIEKKGYTPNYKFKIHFGLIQFTDLQEVILDRLERELPKDLYYHNVKHTVDVVTEVELIGWTEGLSDEEILLLKTAALFHDTGHIVEYDNHEYYGTLIAKEYLPKYGYNHQQIEQVCKIIMATKLPPKPNNLIEEIICDSDLDYLGRSDFVPVSNLLYEELKARNKVGLLNDWNKLQIKFISNHQYFTKTAQKLREVNKQKQIERLKLLISGH
jgi:adenylate cyclase